MQSAISCILEARFTVSPIAVNSTLRSLPRLPTTTGPVCMPMRILRLNIPVFSRFVSSLNLATAR